ncbi:MAG: purine-nucleoside phosphorylase [bacterium]|nr:purine-nucleoside phosphorylase [bacterium]
MDTYDQVSVAVEAIRLHTKTCPNVGIILGTGLGGVVSQMEVVTSIDYEDIPHFPVSTVESHHGKLLFGRLADRDVVVMQGRFHYYEGYSLQQATFPVRVMHALGVHTLLVSNACGGLNPLYRRGDLMLMDDHINLIGDNPLRGKNDERFGPRFPDMSEPYARHLLLRAEQAALRLQHKVHRGVYVAVAGPNLETRAEYRFLRTIGADVVGMSTVPENIVARHMGMDVLGISIVTDECFPDSLQPVHLDDVLAAAALAEPTLTAIFTDVIRHLG